MSSKLNKKEALLAKEVFRAMRIEKVLETPEEIIMEVTVIKTNVPKFITVNIGYERDIQTSN